MLPRLLALAPLLGVLALPAPAEAGGWVWPVSGPVITPYRNGSDPYAAGQHRGIDIAAPTGTPVVAATGGTVRFAGVAGSSGLTVSVRTADASFDTSYLHLSTVAVREGARVDAGSRLGAVGTSGRRSAQQPHLHFGVREAGSRDAYRDPLDFLPPSAPAPTRERPRAAPVPVGEPVRATPRPAPAGGRSPARVRLPRRVPARHPTRVPALRPAPLRAPRTAPVPAMPRLAPATRPGRAPAAQPEGAPHPIPEPGPLPRAAPGSAPTRPTHGRGLPPEPAGRGPDFGWALACAGLLLAAACLARPGGRTEGAGVRHGLRSLIGPLTGGR